VPGERTDNPAKPAAGQAAPTAGAGDSVGPRRARSVAFPTRGAVTSSSHRQQLLQQHQAVTIRTLAPISSVAKKSAVLHKYARRHCGGKRRRT